METKSVSSVKGLKGVAFSGNSLVMPTATAFKAGTVAKLAAGTGGNTVKQQLLNAIATLNGGMGCNSMQLFKAVAGGTGIQSIKALHQHTYGLVVKKQLVANCGSGKAGVQWFKINPRGFGIVHTTANGTRGVMGGGYTIPKTANKSLLAQVRAYNKAGVL